MQVSRDLAGAFCANFGTNGTSLKTARAASQGQRRKRAQEYERLHAISEGRNFHVPGSSIFDQALQEAAVHEESCIHLLEILSNLLEHDVHRHVGNGLHPRVRSFDQVIEV